MAFVLDFSWDDCNTPEQLETTVTAKCGGRNKVHYGLLESFGPIEEIQTNITAATIYSKIKT